MKLTSVKRLNACYDKYLVIELNTWHVNIVKLITNKGTITCKLVSNYIFKTNNKMTDNISLNVANKHNNIVYISLLFSLPN